jgi:Ser/Thr protein kinase RdoA (MazF antagonist)
LIQFFNDGHLELYDLRHDPSEQHNLAQAQPQKAQELLAVLKRWQESVKAPIPADPNPYYNPPAKPRG